MAYDPSIPPPDGANAAQQVAWQQALLNENDAVLAAIQNNVNQKQAQDAAAQWNLAAANGGNPGAGQNANNANNGWNQNALLAAMAGMGNGFGQAANAGASMWNTSQNALASIFNNQANNQTQQMLGQGALNNQAQLYANQLSLGNNTLSTQQQIANAGYQNNLDKINSLFAGLNPLMGTVTSGLGNAFGSLGNAFGNAIGGLGGVGGGGGGLTGFQSSNGVSATLPTGGGLGTYSTGISQTPAMSPAAAQANVSSLGNSQSTAAPQATGGVQNTPAARNTLANMTAARSAQGAQQGATNLDRYQQAAEAKLGYDQQAQNSSTANALQNLLANAYGGGLYRDLNYRQALQQGQLGRMRAVGNLMGSTIGGAGNLVGGLGSMIGGLAG